MLTLKQGKELIKIARTSILNAFEDKETKISKYRNKQGVFVTLHSYPSHELRGCIGFPYPTFPLGKAIIDAAKASAFHDFRFNSVEKGELSKVVIEISVLSVPKEFKMNPKNVEIGKDGLICAYHGRSGLLLPQVPLEWKWDAQQFLEQTCEKAGLPIDIWKEKDCKFYKFQAQIFAEEKPNGKVIWKKE